MNISITSLNYTIINEQTKEGTPTTDPHPRNVIIPQEVVDELGITNTSYQQIGEYLVKVLGEEIGHPISGIAWSVVDNIVPFVSSNQSEPIEAVFSDVIPTDSTGDISLPDTLLPG